MKLNFKEIEHTLLLCMFRFVISVSVYVTSKALLIYRGERRSYVSVWNWIQMYGSSQTYKTKNIFVFMMGELIIQIVN